MACLRTRHFVIHPKKNDERRTTMDSQTKQKRRRNRQMIFRLTDDEYAAVESKIKRAGKKTRADFLISCIGNKPLIAIDGLREIAPELKRQGNNLNQIARALNTERRLTVEGKAMLSDTADRCNALYGRLMNLADSQMPRK
jgi:hypothetical protein